MNSLEELLKKDVIVSSFMKESVVAWKRPENFPAVRKRLAPAMRPAPIDSLLGDRQKEIIKNHLLPAEPFASGGALARRRATLPDHAPQSSLRADLPPLPTGFESSRPPPLPTGFESSPTSAAPAGRASPGWGKTLGHAAVGTTGLAGLGTLMAASGDHSKTPPTSPILSNVPDQNEPNAFTSTSFNPEQRIGFPGYGMTHFASHKEAGLLGSRMSNIAMNALSFLGPGADIAGYGSSMPAASEVESPSSAIVSADPGPVLNRGGVNKTPPRAPIKAPVQAPHPLAPMIPRPIAPPVLLKNSPLRFLKKAEKPEDQSLGSKALSTVRALGLGGSAASALNLASFVPYGGDIYGLATHGKELANGGFNALSQAVGHAPGTTMNVQGMVAQPLYLNGPAASTYVSRKVMAANPDLKIPEGVKHVVQTPYAGSEAITAHELGHGRVNDLLGGRMRHLTQFTPTLAHWGAYGGAVGGALGSSTAATLGTLATLPNLAEEIAASHYGGMGRLRLNPGGSLSQRAGNYLGAYKGVPSYLTKAMMPSLTYGARKMIDRWRAPTQQGSNVKKAFLQELGDTWNGLDTQHKIMTGLGAAVAGGSLLNQLRPRSEGDHASTLGNLIGGVGGTSLAAYGLSGGQMNNVMPTLQNIFAGKQEAKKPSSLAELAKHPKLAKYFSPDGSPRFSDLAKAPDAELKGNLSLLRPEHKSELRNQLSAFKPSIGQRLGAKALGLDIEGQKARFAGLLGDQG